MSNPTHNRPRTVPESLQLMSHRMPYISTSPTPTGINATANNNNDLSQLVNQPSLSSRTYQFSLNHETPRAPITQGLASPSSSNFNTSPILSAPPSVNTTLDLMHFSVALDSNQSDCQCTGAITSLQQRLCNWPQQQNLQALVSVQAAMDDFITISNCPHCLASKETNLLRVALSQQLLLGFQGLLKCWRDLPMTDNITSAELGELPINQGEFCAVYLSLIELHLSRLKFSLQSMIASMDNAQLFPEQRRVLHRTVVGIEALHAKLENTSTSCSPYIQY